MPCVRAWFVVAAVASVAVGACGGDDAGGAPDAAQVDATTSDVTSSQDAGSDEPSAEDAENTVDGGFVHPGILVDSAQLAFVKNNLGSDPWKTALAKVLASKLASKTYKATPAGDVKCDSFDKDPDSGATEVACTTQVNDATAAYTDALLWVYTGDAAYATTGIAIIDAWSNMLTQMSGSNAPLQSAWVTEQLTRAAEIFRHTSSGWTTASTTSFSKMLTTVFLPLVVGGSPSSNGNWELSMADAVMGIGVFTDDHATFDEGVALWRARVPAYIYLTGDTDAGIPIYPPGGKYSTPAKLASFWYNQTIMFDGLCQETCRDLNHVQLGFASLIYAAETARIQGIDLYGEQRARISKGFEFNATYINGAAVPSTLCGGQLAISTNPTWEIGYNQLANRDGLPMPETDKLIAKIRPTTTTQQMAWETLTHAATFDAGDP